MCSFTLSGFEEEEEEEEEMESETRTEEIVEQERDQLICDFFGSCQRDVSACTR